MFDYCRNLSGLLGMFSLFIQQEISSKDLSKPEYMAAVLQLIDENGANFRHQYCTLHCDKKALCTLENYKSRVSL